MVSASLRALLVLVLTALPGLSDDGPRPVTWTAAASAVTCAIGARCELTLNASIASGWHLFALTGPERPRGYQPTSIVIVAAEGVQADGAVVGPSPRRVHEAAIGAEALYYDNSASFRIPIRITADLVAESLPVRVKVRYQACSTTLCLRPTVHVQEFTVAIRR